MENVVLRALGIAIGTAAIVGVLGLSSSSHSVFFFQAEDGIRDPLVTGVQTCALPIYGHRRDVAGYARCLEELDARLPEVVAELGDGDWLLLTADHGCDPTAPGTDHTRELVPMVAFSPGGTAGTRLADRATFADLGATVADLFGVDPVGPGRSFAAELAP